MFLITVNCFQKKKTRELQKTGVQRTVTITEIAKKDNDNTQSEQLIKDAE